MRNILTCIVVIVLLASSVLVAVIPSTAQELVVPGDKDGDKIVSEGELVEALMAYMQGEYLGESVEHLSLDELREAAHIHVYYPRTITDASNRAVTVYMPITRIITLTSDSAEAVRMLGEVDNIVGVTDTIKGGEGGAYFSELADKPSVGTWKAFDYEGIVEIARGDSNNAVIPDILVICDAYGYYYDVFDVEEKLSPFGIAVAGLPLYEQSKLEEEMEELGYLLEREDRAADYIAWRQDKEAAVRRAVDGLAKPKVYIEKGSSTGMGELKTYGKGSALAELCALAGGDNIAKNMDENYPAVDWAWVISPDQYPEVILKEEPNTWLGVTEEAETMREDVLTRIPGDIPAIQNGRVYIVNRKIDYGLGNVVGLTSWAKIFHPSVSLDPEAVYRDYLAFQGVGYPEDRIAVYPSLPT
ncbi:MAG: ABC transporter substrate-binding protein [Methanomicrobia archaeon]|nr:ABC transporter substrate-binding protein [Methanomicrobia archaeon]